MDKSILQKAIAKWGEENQIHKIQEEALELALILNQISCPTKDPEAMDDALYDELADMKIMMAQAEIIFGSERINDRVNFKLNTLKAKYFTEGEYCKFCNKTPCERTDWPHPLEEDDL